MDTQQPASPDQANQHLRATLALCLGSLMVFANLYTTQPLLAILMENYRISELEAAQSLTVATLMLGASLLVYGPLSDALGRKAIMVTSLCGATLTTLALSQVTSFEQLLWLRALQGFLLGGLPAIAIAYIGEEFPKHKIAATIGVYISANSLGGISGRIISGVASDWLDWQSVFLVMSIINIVITLFFSLALPRSTTFEAGRFNVTTIASNIIGHFKNRYLLVAFLIGGGNFMIFLTLYSYIIFVLSEAPFNLSSSWLGLLFLTYLSGSIGSALTGKIANKLSCAQRIAIGTAIIVIGAGCTLHTQLWAIISGLLICAFGFFLAHSSLTAWINQYATTAKASASSLYLVFYYIGASIGTTYLNPFWQWAQWQGVITGATITLLFCLLAACWLRAQERQI